MFQIHAKIPTNRPLLLLLLCNDGALQARYSWWLFDAHCLSTPQPASLPWEHIRKRFGTTFRKDSLHATLQGFAPIARFPLISKIIEFQCDLEYWSTEYSFACYMCHLIAAIIQFARFHCGFVALWTLNVFIHTTFLSHSRIRVFLVPQPLRRWRCSTSTFGIERIPMQSCAVWYRVYRIHVAPHQCSMQRSTRVECIVACCALLIRRPVRFLCSRRRRRRQMNGHL